MNAVIFDLKVSGLPSDALSVVRVEGEETLNRPYLFEIDVICTRDELPIDDILGQPATFTLKRGEADRKIHGVIQSISEGEEAAGGFFAYTLALVPRIAMLSLSQHNRSFGTQTAMSVVDVILSVLCDPEGIGLSQGDYAVRLLQPDNYKPRDFWTQYDESDFDFVHRLLEHWGIVYYFEQLETSEKIWFTDATYLSSPQTVDAVMPFDGGNGYNPGERGVVRSLERHIKAITKRVLLKDYNDQTPQLTLTAGADVAGGVAGQYSEYASHFLNENEGDLFAKARAEEIACTRDTYELTTDSPFSTPGASFTVEGHFKPVLNRSYIPVSVSHRGGQMVAGAFSGKETPGQAGYKSTIKALPRRTPYRSPRVIRRPVMAGIMPAVIEAADEHSSRAMLDPQGRYKVAIDFDTADNTTTNHSPFVRRLQSYAGAGMGIHFPLLKDTEVMIGWVDGDPDRPLILGAVANPRAASPVVKTNQTENKLRTASGMAFIMNDGQGQPASAEPGLAAAAIVAKTLPPAPVPTPASAAPVQTAPEPRNVASSPESSEGYYTAFMVPSGSAAPPDYLRIGNVATADGYENKIIADPGFRAGAMEFRGTELTNEQYGGIFSYTNGNRTTATRGNETVSVGGNHRVDITGTSVTTVRVKPGANLPAAAGDDPPPPAPDLPDIYSTTTNLYTANILKTASISYVTGESIAFVNGLSVAAVGGMSVTMGFAGSYTYGLGPSVTVAGLPGPLAVATLAYTVGTWGAITMGSAGIEPGHAAFCTDSYVFGYRGLQGKPWTTAALVVSTSAALLSIGTYTATNALQNKIKDAVTPSDFANVKVQQNIVTMGAATAHASGFATGIAYTAKGQPMLLANLLKEPTLTIDKTGITLMCGGNSIVINNAGITMKCAPLIPLGSATTIKVDASDVAVTAETMTLKASERIDLSAALRIALGGGDSAVEIGNGAKIIGKLSVSEDVVTAGSVSAGGQLSAPSAQIG